MKTKLTCVICDSEDFDLMSVKHPLTKKPLGIIYCCEGCKSKLLEEIKLYATILAEGLEARQREMIHETAQQEAFGL